MTDGKGNLYLCQIVDPHHEHCMVEVVATYNEYEKTGTGFSFANYNAHEMMHTVRYAEEIYYSKKRDWNKIVERAMAKDFSWKTSAKQYEELYKNL